jgi:hypothetical protein
MNEDDEILLDEISTWCSSIDGLVEHLQPELEKLNDNVKTFISSVTISLNRQGVNPEEMDQVVLADESTAH